jgi:predicted dehydrogenase
MEKVRMGVIGTGMAWDRLHRPAIQELGDKYEVLALCDRDEGTLQRAAGALGLSPDNTYTHHKEMLKRDDLDVVLVAVPIPDNYQVSLDVAKAGKNIICEKPLAHTMEDARRFLNMAKEHNVAILIAENYRYNEEINKIRELVEGGKIGRVVYLIMNHVACFPCQMTENTFYAKEWRQHPKFRGGNFLDAAIHDLAGLHHIFGPVDKTFAFGIPQREDYSPYLYINANFKFKSGVIGHYSYYPEGKEMQRPLVGLRIFGDNGTIYLEERNCGTINMALNNGETELIPYTPMRGYYNEFLNLYNALVGKETIYVTPETAFGDVELIFDILDSIEEERPNPVDSHNWPHPMNGTKEEAPLIYN